MATAEPTDLTGPFLSARWESLVMLNWEVDPTLLLDRVPAGTRLDLWQGRAYVSVVGFLFADTRLLGVPIPWHRTFEEVNLRFYVGRQGAEGWRRGVCFVRELVPRAAVAALARRVYNEPYLALPMAHTANLGEAGGSAEYRWLHGGRWNRLAARVTGPPAAADCGSAEEFITEHYWGYTRRRDGGTVEYRVEHPSWRVWRATDATLDADVRDLYGDDFARVLAAPPSSALVADGSPVVVRRARRLR